MKKTLYLLLAVAILVLVIIGCSGPTDIKKPDEDNSEPEFIEKAYLKAEFKENVSDDLEDLAVGAYNLFAGLDSLGAFDSIKSYTNLINDANMEKARKQLYDTSYNAGLSKNENSISIYTGGLDVALDKLEEAVDKQDEEAFNKYAKQVRSYIKALGDMME